MFGCMIRIRDLHIPRYLRGRKLHSFDNTIGRVCLKELIGIFILTVQAQAFSNRIQSRSHNSLVLVLIVSKIVFKINGRDGTIALAGILILYLGPGGAVFVVKLKIELEIVVLFVHVDLRLSSLKSNK